MSICKMVLEQFQNANKDEDFKLHKPQKDCKPDERNGDYVTTNDKFYIKMTLWNMLPTLNFNDRIAFFPKN